MAVQVHQDRVHAKDFHEQLREREHQRREDVAGGLERRIPVLGHVVAPLVYLTMCNDDRRTAARGADGEGAVARTLRRLPAPWHCMNDRVFERSPGAFMQIDHIAVGPGGVFVIETKN